MSDDRTDPLGPDADDALAAEFALGVLDAVERARCTVRIERDPDFAQRVSDWEGRFSGLNESYAAVAPPAAVKARLDTALFPKTGEPKPGGHQSVWQSLMLWRGLALASMIGLATLVALDPRAPEPPDPTLRLVASLVQEDGDARFVALYEPETATLRVTLLSGDGPTDRDYELWLLAGDTPPVSLGLVGGSGDAAPSVPADFAPAFEAGAALAISVEPVGGSPGPAPTGPIIALGDIVRF
ncbi:MAG: anti-sigma factor [Pseudomonadota bacterium]